MRLLNKTTLGAVLGASALALSTARVSQELRAGATSVGMCRTA